MHSALGFATCPSSHHPLMAVATSWLPLHPSTCMRKGSMHIVTPCIPPGNYPVVLQIFILMEYTYETVRGWCLLGPKGSPPQTLAPSFHPFGTWCRTMIHHSSISTPAWPPIWTSAFPKWPATTTWTSCSRLTMKLTSRLNFNRLSIRIQRTGWFGLHPPLKLQP